MHHKALFLIIFVLSNCLSSCISRLSRPAITGYIFDYDNRPVPDCKIGETQTDQDGKFYLKEIRSNRFLLTEMLVMEAPPVFFSLDISKDGYQSYSNDFFQRHGGARRKGAVDNLDTIYIKRLDEVIPIEKYLYDDWTFAANRSLDTLYGTNKNYRINNIINNKSDLRDRSNWGLAYRYRSSEVPDSSWRPQSYDLITTYKVSLRSEGTYQGKLIQKYLNPWRHRREHERTYRESYQIPTDSSNSTGVFKLSGNTLYFDKAFDKNHDNNLYQIDSIDRDVLILIRVDK